MKTVLLVVAACLVTAAAMPAGASAASRHCGTKPLYDRTLTIVVTGKLISCARTRRIIRGPCDEGRVFSCFSFRPPAPMLVWFREKERYRRHWTTVIEARRYPCSEAAFTREEWERPGAIRGGFPTRQQLLADDVIRCHMLDGRTEAQVRELLGKPHDVYRQDGVRYLDWQIGEERDSFIQIDGESLSIAIGRDGLFKSAEIYQN